MEAAKEAAEVAAARADNNRPRFDSTQPVGHLLLQSSCNFEQSEVERFTLAAAADVVSSCQQERKHAPKQQMLASMRMKV